MKQLFFSMAVLLMCSSVHAQNIGTNGNQANLSGNPIVRCGFDEYQKELQKGDYHSNRNRFEQWMSSKVAAEKLRKGTQVATYTVPVIFHVIYENADAVGTGSNIAASRIADQMKQLNADYGNLTGSTYSQAANTTLQFCLAQKGPSGNILAEPGIDRINRNTKGFTAPPYSKTYVDGTIKAGTYWNPKEYVNIWLLVSMESNPGFTLLGYATFPTGSGLPGLSGTETDRTAGVALLTSAIGSLASPNAGCASTISYGKGRTLTHELGHYFGLRHIWGDNNGDCSLDDFCGDTPRAAASNSGCSKGINTCNDVVYAGAPIDYPDMVENYMDYSDDACMNTFTANQKDRIVAVLTNSPRRKELLTSPAGLSNTRQVSFVTTLCGAVSSTRVSEDIPSATCPRYRDVPVSLQVFTAATGAATLTINTAGTATAGVDYDIIGGRTVTFAAGDNSRNIMIRIYDDAIPEGDETIQLSYTISGTGVTAGSSDQTMNLVIAASDQNVPIGQNSVTLLNENFDATTGFPTGWASLAAGTPLNRWTVSPNGGAGTTGNAAHISQNYNNTTPSLRTNTYNATATSRAVLSTPLIDATGLNNLQLSFTWRCLGEEAGGTVYDYGRLISSTADDPLGFGIIPGTAQFLGQATAQNYAFTMPASFNNAKFHIGFDWLNDNSAGNNPGFTIDRVLLTGTLLQIETQLSQAAIETVPAGTAIRFISNPNQRLIAQLNNTTASVGCIKGELAEAGTGQVPVTTTGGSFRRSKKVIQLTPQVNDTTSSYDVTVYFTIQEMAGWTNPATLKILKVKDATNLSGVIASRDAQILVPTAIDNQLATKGYIAYTCRATGFSKFMLVEQAAALPATLLDFIARPDDRKIVLNWTIAREQNSKGFQVERSIDGQNFTTISWVPSLGNTGDQQVYMQIDKDVVHSVKYYYRLKQEDLNGQYTYSPVRDAMTGLTAGSIRIYPNPVKNTLFIVPAANMEATVQVLNPAGEVVVSLTDVMMNGQYELNVDHLTPGIYLLKVIGHNGELFMQRWVKE